MTIPMPRRRRLTRIGVPVLVFGGAAATIAWSAWHTLVPAPLVRTTPVVVRLASLPDGADGAQAATSSAAAVQAAGWIEPAPFPIAVPALAEGVIESMTVLEGERVERGAVIARLVTDDADIAVANAAAEVAVKDAAVAAARAARERARVERDTLVEETRALAVAESKVAAAEAAIALLDADARTALATEVEASDALRRLEGARAGGGVSEADVVRAASRAEAARAAVAALPARRRMLDAALAEAQADARAARTERELLVARTASLAAADAALAGAIAEQEMANARRDEASLRRRRMDVRAPADGVVLARLAAPGMRVGGDGDAPVAQLYDPSSLQVRADVANVDIGLVGVGMPATITVEALPNQTLTGRVTRIVGQADLQKNTVQVKIAIDEPPATLRPDMLCRVRIGGPAQGGPTQASRMRLFVPKSLVRDGAVVTIGPVDRGLARAATRKVEVGADSGEWVEVVHGLAPGDLLVDPSIADGAAVRVESEGTDAA
ncbi:MAG: efflux RND transporter periplasmic adaptor subunit [Phycisphaerae bacterium]|nr:efflux RND transporter periplasmic adaptor subunit [Phycisphaerae bacterium]